MGAKPRVIWSHPWDLSPKAAIALQREGQGRVIRRDDFNRIQCVAGADVAFSPDKKFALAGIILFSFPELIEIQRVKARKPLCFPYVPGLLTFREGPALEAAYLNLIQKPDFMIFDGQGLAHPRGFGIATHLGLRWNVPSIGCAKSRLCGEYNEPGIERGNWAPLNFQGRRIGAVLRTRDGVRPVFVSAGHRVSLESARKILLQCHDGTRIPKPTREADRWVAEWKRSLD